MHTSAQAAVATMLEYSGTLVHSAQARTRVLDGSAAVPVLCMDIELDNTLHTLMHVEQPFAPDQFQQAEAAAHRLKKGMRVTVHAPLLDLRLVANNAAQVTVLCLCAHRQHQPTCHQPRSSGETRMPSVTITLTDTPAGSVSIKSDFSPAVGRGAALRKPLHWTSSAAPAASMG